MVVWRGTWVQVERDKAWTRQNSKCFWHKGHIRRCEATADHKVPKSLGGTDKGNIVAACHFCNQAKGSIPPKDFKRMITGGMPTASPEIEVVRIMRGIERQTDRATANIRRIAR